MCSLNSDWGTDDEFGEVAMLVEALDVCKIFVFADVDILESYVILDIIQIRQVAIPGI